MSEEPVKPDRRQLRVVVADDDQFTVSLVADGLRAQGFEVHTASHTNEAWQLVAETDPHALVSDLNFGAGESGAVLLSRVADDFPWVGLVVLTSHTSPQLAVGDASELPPNIVYLVKSQLRNTEDLGSAVMSAIAGETVAMLPDEDTVRMFVVTGSQADVLRMLAEGASTRALAESRGTTVRAAETMLTRLYTALALDGNEHINSRTAAIQLWQQGRIRVR